MNRVLEAWKAGDIVNRNPFLHKSLWMREDRRKPVKAEENSLAGYEPEADIERAESDTLPTIVDFPK